LVQRQWTAPQGKKKVLLPFAFIPSNLINELELPTCKRIASEKKLLFDKRSSGSKSFGISRKSSMIPMIDAQIYEKMVPTILMNKAEACLIRKQAK
jgi:hypothetical protein